MSPATRLLAFDRKATEGWAIAETVRDQPTMFHCKVMVVDNLWTSVGAIPLADVNLPGDERFINKLQV